MAYASGYITITEIDISGYDDEIDIEFDGVEDVVNTAEANNISKEEIIEYCFDDGRISPVEFVKDYLTFEQIAELYKDTVLNRLDEMGLTISSRHNTIRELKDKINELTMSDEEAIKNVAY